MTRAGKAEKSCERCYFGNNFVVYVIDNKPWPQYAKECDECKDFSNFKPAPDSLKTEMR